MNKQELENLLGKASFNVNKRFEKPDHFPDDESVLKQVQSLIEQGRSLKAIDMINEHRQEKPGVVKGYPKLLIAEGIALVALQRIDDALATLRDASVIYKQRLGKDTNNNAWKRNLSTVKSNIAECLILQKDYKNAEKSALEARTLCCTWHGPHINIFTAYRRLNDDEALIGAFEEMLKIWPNWNLNESMMSHLYGNDNQIRDPDLVGVVEMLTTLGYELKPA